MKKLFWMIFITLLIHSTTLKAQITVAAYPAQNPQSGSPNYFGVRVTLTQIYDQDITVTGYIYDEGSEPNTDYPFSLTVSSGDLISETSETFYVAEPNISATVEVASIVTIYAGVTITYEANGGILMFNSLSDLNAVIEQLDADNENYNAYYESQYPNATDDEMDDIDEQNNFDEFRKYRDFEKLFGGFYSKRAEIETIENAWLENNFSGTNPDDVDLTFDDAENTVFNSNYSVKVDNDIYQYTNSGWYINGEYQEDGGSNSMINRPNELIYANANLQDWKAYSGPGDFCENNNFFIPLLNSCKTNKKYSTDKINLSGTNRYIVMKVAIHSIGVTHSIKSKVVHFKMKNGKPKRSKTDLQVRVDGIIRNTVCEDEYNEFRNDPYTIGTYKKRASLRARISDIGGPIWRTFQGDVVGTYWTKDGFTEYYPLTW